VSRISRNKMALSDAGRLGIDDSAIPEADRWNHNIHYFDVLIDAVGEQAQSVLDVGCGDGMLTRRLCAVATTVTGIDLDEHSITVAKSETTQPGISYVVGDILTYPFEVASFDAVVAVVMLHHLDTVAGLRRMASLVRPGGVLAIEGVAQSRIPNDLLWNTCGAVATQILKRSGGRRFYHHPSPIKWPPPDTFADIRRIAAQELPGVQYQRHVLWRYTLVWRKPH
jgi:2-polyprenyl-3-methyl-5-hydroxy-6-metoxy-1,4-benzoquinol methylase